MIAGWEANSTDTKRPQISWNRGHGETTTRVRIAVIRNGEWRVFLLGPIPGADRLISLLQVHGLVSHVAPNAQRTNVGEELTHDTYLWSEPVDLARETVVRLARIVR